MSSNHSDALVFYGVTGDLAFKKIFPALQAMVRRGHLDVPVIGVARSAWTVDRLRQRVHDGLEKYGGVDPAACRAIHNEVKDGRHPVIYLAVPPDLFAPAVEQLAKSGCAKGARIIIEKPFGRDLASAKNLNRISRSFRRIVNLSRRSLSGKEACEQHAGMSRKHGVSSIRS